MSDETYNGWCNYTHAGNTKTLPAWASEYNIPYTTLYARLKRGWSLEKALTTPLQVQSVAKQGHKKCADCQETKELKTFCRLKRRGGNEYASICRLCDRKRTKEYRLTTRLLVLEHYSGTPPKCQDCGEGRVLVLDLDHINGGGSKERRHYPSTSLYRSIIAYGYPDGYRILCRNCNWIRHIENLAQQVNERRYHDE